MLNQYLGSILTETTNNSISLTDFAVCFAVAILLGGVIGLLYSRVNRGSKSFVITLALLPCIVQIVIMLVNGNLGTGVAVMGAFGLVRFRSAPGNAKEICNIFLAMAVGLATGMGYILIAALSVGAVEIMMMLYTMTRFGEWKREDKVLKITIPESLDYVDVFRDIFNKYTTATQLLQVRTTNMGSLYKLEYQITLKSVEQEKAFIDELRCRNGNLEIICGRVGSDHLEL